jgi:hypothetical protein
MNLTCGFGEKFLSTGQAELRNTNPQGSAGITSFETSLLTGAYVEAVQIRPESQKQSAGGDDRMCPRFPLAGDLYPPGGDA